MANVDYAKVIDANNYTQGLAEHPDIPQSDAGIVGVISEKLKNTKNREFKVLDLGCGPGRITKLIAEVLVPIARKREIHLSVIGFDISEGFISFAREHKSGESISYILDDFLTYNFTEHFDVVLMQGLFHHVPLDTRQRWIEKCRDIVDTEGVIIIGDEFIPDYSSGEERILKVAGLYSYVVAYALQNGHTSLAEIESMNMVDDICAGSSGAGHSNKELITFIQNTSLDVYACIYEKGAFSKEYEELLKKLVERIQHDAAELAANDANDHNRGDYKISVEKQVEELAKIGLRLERRQTYGPIQWLGGMGVLTFKKS